MLEIILWLAAQPLYNLSLGVAGGLLTNLLQKMMDKEKKQLKSDMEAILKNLSPKSQKEFKNISIPKKLLFQANLLPISVNQDQPDNLNFLKNLLVSALPQEFSEREDFVNDFTSFTIIHFDQKSDPILQSKINKVRTCIDNLGEKIELQDEKIDLVISQTENLTGLDDIRGLFKEFLGDRSTQESLDRHLYISIDESGGTWTCTLHDENKKIESQEIENPFRDDHFKFCLNRLKKPDVKIPVRETAPKYKITDREQESMYIAKKIYQILFPLKIEIRIREHLEDLRQRKADRLFMVLNSGQSIILNLPFEMAYSTSEGFIFLNQRIYVSRTLVSSDKYFADYSPVPLAPPPLRILISVSALDDLPENQKMLDFDLEQELIIKALDPLTSRGLAKVDFTVGGSLSEIESFLETGKHHILHLSGHGRFDGSTGYFVFENDQGLTQEVSAQNIAKRLKDFTSLRLVILSGCQTAEFTNYENINGTVQSLSHYGVPFVIGMQRTISDPGATRFAQFFYTHMACESTVDEAVFVARKKMKQVEEKELKEGRPDIVTGEWAVPVIYRFKKNADIIDFSQIPLKPERKIDSELLFNGAHHLGKGFVGRRREIRQFYRLFNDDEKAIAVWGYGGIGKSSLATRLSEELNKRSDFHVFGFKGTVSPEIIIS